MNETERIVNITSKYGEYSPTTLEQRVTSLGYSPLTSSMLLSVVQDYTTDDYDRWMVFEAIKGVINGEIQPLGDVFEERVWEAVSYTPDPFASY